MIPITLTWFVGVYLALFLAGVLVLWIGYEMTRKRRATRIARDRVFCRICGTCYTETTGTDLTDCPVCGSRNERSGQAF